GRVHRPPACAVRARLQYRRPRRIAHLPVLAGPSHLRGRSHRGVWGRLHPEQLFQGVLRQGRLARRPRSVRAHPSRRQQGGALHPALAGFGGLEGRLRGRQERHLHAGRGGWIAAAATVSRRNIRQRRVPVGTLVVLAVYAAITAAVTAAALNMEPFGVLIRDGRLDGLQDFASHPRFPCSVWSGDAARAGGSSAYALPARLDATERWSGMSPRIALPFGYSPTMAWILGPFCLLPPRGAFVGWVLAGFVCTIAAIVRAKARWW